MTPLPTDQLAVGRFKIGLYPCFDLARLKNLGHPRKKYPENRKKLAMGNAPKKSCTECGKLEVSKLFHMSLVI